MVMLHYNGIPRKVVVDDLLPVGRDGALLCSRTTLRGELWVCVLEKAYMKLQGGYDFGGGNSGIDLHALTGWIPETVQLDAPSFDRERTWKRLLNGQRHGLCLATVGTAQMSEAEERRWGLVSNHAYAVLDVREVEVGSSGAYASGEGRGSLVGERPDAPRARRRLLQLKNPWTRRRWRGELSAEDAASWTERLREALRYDPASDARHDNGVFWIPYEALYGPPRRSASAAAGQVREVRARRPQRPHRNVSLLPLVSPGHGLSSVASAAGSLPLLFSLSRRTPFSCSSKVNVWIRAVRLHPQSNNNSSN
jgi:calpain-7